jgi:pimeloyl-ACP methyl ester carboxylesterase
MLICFRISGYVNQAANQKDILAYLASQVKLGSYTGHLGKPKKLVLVGHSFGSFISQGVLAADPTAADGAILTGLGYTMDTATSIEAFVLRISATQDDEFKNRDNGYLTWADVYANINKLVPLSNSIMPWLIL